MRKILRYILLVALTTLLPSCDKQQDHVLPEHEHTAELPEIFEKELRDITDRGWKDLSDTLGYYYDNLLSKGVLNGIGPDGVKYSLDIEPSSVEVEAAFSIQDSVWMNVIGHKDPLYVTVYACRSEMTLSRGEAESVIMEIEHLSFEIPTNIRELSDFIVPFSMYDSPVGYLTLEAFENPDYSSGYYLVAHFNDYKNTLSYNDSLGLYFVLSDFLDIE